MVNWKTARDFVAVILILNLVATLLVLISSMQNRVWWIMVISGIFAVLDYLSVKIIYTKL